MHIHNGIHTRRISFTRVQLELESERGFLNFNSVLSSTGLLNMNFINCRSSKFLTVFPSRAPRTSVQSQDYAHELTVLLEHLDLYGCSIRVF